MKKLAVYALVYNQAVVLNTAGLWEELSIHEKAGHVIRHYENPERGVVTFEVWQIEAGDKDVNRTWESLLASQLRVSLVIERERAGRKGQ